MQIWADADACPKVIKDFLFRAAERRHLGAALEQFREGAGDLDGRDTKTRAE